MFLDVVRCLWLLFVANRRHSPWNQQFRDDELDDSE